MSNDFEENVLISKREYITLKEQLAKKTMSEKDKVKSEMSGEKDVKFTNDHLRENEPVSDTDSNASRQTTSETAEQSAETKDNILGPAEAKSPEKNNEHTLSDKVDTGETVENNNDGDLVDKPASNSVFVGENSQDEHVSDNLPKDRIPRDMDKEVDTLLSKVTAKLKDGVRVLVRYILDNGSGIIEWDDKLRFVYMQQTMPRTNIVKLLTYTLEKTGSAPKGTSVFLRALRSMGLDKPREYVSKQTAKFSKSEHMESKDTDTGTDTANRSPTAEPATVDGVDGGAIVNAKNKEGPAPTARRKSSRYANLKAKWTVW